MQPDGPRHGNLPGPIPGTPDRVPGSVRRTVSLDVTRPHGPDGPLRLLGRGRDLVTAADGSGTVAGAALLSGIVTDDRVSALSTHPSPPGIERLRGRPAVVGWRTGLWRYVRTEHDAGSVLHLLLDDLPGAMIIGGFTRRRQTSAVAQSPQPQPGRRLDVCAGWAVDSYAAQHLSQTGRPPPPTTPIAPEIRRPDDPSAWHTLPPVPVFGISRRRRIEALDTGDEVAVEGWFRDSFTDADGSHRVLHEYRVSVTADRESYVVRRLTATPRVLPHRDCPVGAASAQQMRGVALGDLRDRVSADLFGPTSCTHLNDLLRSLTDVPALLA